MAAVQAATGGRLTWTVCKIGGAASDNASVYAGHEEGGGELLNVIVVLRRSDVLIL